MTPNKRLFTQLWRSVSQMRHSDSDLVLTPKTDRRILPIGIFKGISLKQTRANDPFGLPWESNSSWMGAAHFLPCFSPA